MEGPRSSALCPLVPPGTEAGHDGPSSLSPAPPASRRGWPGGVRGASSCRASGWAPRGRDEGRGLFPPALRGYGLLRSPRCRQERIAEEWRDRLLWTGHTPPTRRTFVPGLPTLPGTGAARVRAPVQ